MLYRRRAAVIIHRNTVKHRNVGSACSYGLIIPFKHGNGFGASGGKSREGRAAQLTADIAAWQTRFAGSVTLWVSYPDALCTAATDALGTTGTSLGMENLLVTSSTELDADSRAALEQAAADAGVQHVVVHDAAAFR